MPTTSSTETTNEEIELASLQGDIKNQMRRIRGILEGGTVTPDQVLTEVLHTVFPLMLDHLTLTDRLEEHAEWAGEQIDALAGGDGPQSSQLLPEDAERFALFIDKVLALCSATLDSLGADDASAQQRADLQAIIEAGRELTALVKDLTLEDEPSDDEQPDGPDGVARAAIDRAVPKDEEGGIVNLPPAGGSG